MNSEQFSSSFDTAKDIGANIITDPKLLKAASKIGGRSLQAAGVTRKTLITRRTKVDYEGVGNAIANPAEAGLLAANQLRKDLPRIAFHLGRATLGAVSRQRQEAAIVPTPAAESFAEPNDAALAQSYGQTEANVPFEAALPAPQAPQPADSHEFALAR